MRTIPLTISTMVLINYEAALFHNNSFGGQKSPLPWRLTQLYEFFKILMVFMTVKGIHLIKNQFKYK